MARFMASKSTLPTLLARPHRDFPQPGQGVMLTERKALIDSNSSFGAFGAAAEGVRCGRSGGA